METLPAFVRHVMAEKHLSGYAIERATNRKITQSYVNRIKNGEIATPSAVKLQALAHGLGVPEGELFAVVRGIEIDGRDLVHERLQAINRAYADLSVRDRKKADYLINLLAREIAKIEDDSA